MLYEAIIEKVKIPTKHFLLFHTSVLQMGGASLTKAILKNQKNFVKNTKPFRELAQERRQILFTQIGRAHV